MTSTDDDNRKQQKTDSSSKVIHAKLLKQFLSSISRKADRGFLQLQQWMILINSISVLAVVLPVLMS